MELLKAAQKTLKAIERETRVGDALDREVARDNLVTYQRALNAYLAGDERWHFHLHAIANSYGYRC